MKEFSADEGPDGQLKVSYGIYFRNVRYLQPATDYYYVNLHVDTGFSIFDEIRNIRLHPLDCQNNVEPFSKHLCQDFIPVFEQYNERANRKQDILDHKVDSFRLLTGMRDNQVDERGIPLLLLSGFFSMGSKH